MCIRDRDTATYQDATFFVKGNRNLDQVIKDLKKLDINWRSYNLIKSSSNFPALQKSISGIYSIAVSYTHLKKRISALQELR